MVEERRDTPRMVRMGRNIYMLRIRVSSREVRVAEGYRCRAAGVGRADGRLCVAGGAARASVAGRGAGVGVGAGVKVWSGERGRGERGRGWVACRCPRCCHAR